MLLLLGQQSPSARSTTHAPDARRTLRLPARRQVSARLLLVYRTRQALQAVTGASDAQLLDNTLKEVVTQLYEPGFKVR